MAITSAGICAAADQLQGFVGFNHKTGKHIVRFSEDSFGLDVADDSITPTCEFVWNSVGQAAQPALMTLKRERLQLLLDLRIDERLNITEPLRVYVRRDDIPEITAERRLRQNAAAS
ncbi:DUF2025 family protein [Phytopseudomonas dryadis]|uniref:DUF2025 domain-containing protein n=1 Tax=Phytopseudomonas dryadis TaxID=2487520 RepID=A0A4V2KBR2_9GAMM|nr:MULTISPECIES: DUF2025 family protein [Pseudomonas]TBU88294.1 DUF2025 domain-containing protein [Pseudomonas dryadis]TBV05477.1 DUF2025 domain-containing protein [Pseudomonas dryadis]TBV18486.1 DUF2025 domain-containing protein [Pseudomonas sp. FRB 230]